jgi:hypothetical protein
MHDLLELAFDDPAAAERQAGEILVAETDPAARAVAMQALGIVFRESGRTKDAIHVLRQAVAAAAESGVADRLSDVRATYAGALVFAGRSRAGLVEFERAADGAGGVVAARVKSRHAT